MNTSLYDLAHQNSIKNPGRGHHAFDHLQPARACELAVQVVVNVPPILSGYCYFRTRGRLSRLWTEKLPPQTEE